MGRDTFRKNRLTDWKPPLIFTPGTRPKGWQKKNPSNPKTPGNEEKSKTGAKKERNESTAPDATHQSSWFQRNFQHSILMTWEETTAP